MQLRVALGDGVEVGAVKLGGGDLLPLEQPLRLLGGQAQRVDARGHTVGGTLKRSPSTAPARSRSLSSRERLVRHVLSSIV